MYVSYDIMRIIVIENGTMKVNFQIILSLYKHNLNKKPVLFQGIYDTSVLTIKPHTCVRQNALYPPLAYETASC